MKDTRMANRGREFEELIDQANEWYRSKGIGLIQKVPTEWRILRAYDERTKRQKIISAFPVRKSKVEYTELFYNSHIAFKNIEQQQREFLEFLRSLGGKAFYLVNFKVHKQIFIITSYQLNKFIET